ncbi:MAG: hypothetical protein JAY78_24875, partial [Candidatus Thiodiazotropha taylori]|nr:hypothetical protein [Candidatus Thiodiazotropha taylori]
MDTETVANALIEIFSRTGIPKEILSDQGSNFTSALMRELCKLLNIKKLTSTPYHPEANGLVEKFNGTLKKMLSCFVENEKEDWDKYLPYLLFSYREVPQDTTGFSPFELLYGRHVRGPLTVIRETWEEPNLDNLKESVVSYLLKTRDMLLRMSDIAHQSEIKNKTRQKLYYDRRSANRKLCPGQKVRVLLPTCSNKLLADWKGPFTVFKQVSPVDYEIQMDKKVKKTFHINMLKEWIERGAEEPSTNSVNTEASNMVGHSKKERHSFNNVVLDSEDEEKVGISIENPLLSPHENIHDIKLDDHLSENQVNELRHILSSYADVLSDVPEKTSLIEHDVIVKSDVPVTKKAYMLPYALREKVKLEVDNMLEAGIAEKSNSPYASPIVVVPKKDLSIRLCVDYRLLNKNTVFDPQ